MSQIAMDWKKIAIILGLDVVTIDRIAKQHIDDIDGAIIAVFQRWIEDASALPYSHDYPLSWCGLNEILEDSQLNTAAKKYFEFLKTC